MKSEVQHASELIEQKKFDQASKILTKVIESDPGDAKALYYAGMAAFGEHNYQLSADKLSASLNIDPSFSPAYSQRSLAYTRLGDQDNAIADINQAISLTPDVAKNYHRRAIIQLNSKEYSLALADLEKTQALDPKETPFFVHMNRAESYFGLKKYSQALADYDKAVKLAPPGNHDAYLRRALARARSGDFKGARLDCISFLKKYPEDPEAHALQGALHSIAGDDDKAAKDYLKAIQGAQAIWMAELTDFGADNSETVTNLIDVCLKVHKAQLASAILTSVESHRPLEPQEQYRLALANFAMKRPERAIALLNSCIAMSPDYVEPRVQLIRYYSLNGMDHKALDLQREAYAVAKSQGDRARVAEALIRRR